jgi:endonuclease V-like protein UPF0215 family
MKRQIRILGIDDSSFSFGAKHVPVIGVVVRGSAYIEGVLRTTVVVDGRDATRVLTRLINHTRHKEQLKTIMLDGVALGGFNIVDIEELNEATGVPVITITRDEPDFEKIKDALRKHFDDWNTRWATLSRGTLERIEGHYPLYVKHAGISLEDVKEIIRLSTIRGAIPEPIRLAHVIATGIVTGESYGRA